jgi:hypothetical protein
VLRSPGQPLDAATRAFMEPRFGHDFSRVRVHADAKANESALAVNALAYTMGNSVVFGSGNHTLHTTEGRKLLAHELTHVIQQSPIQVGDMASPTTGAGEAAEREAAAVAEDVMSGGRSEPLARVAPGSVQRQQGKGEYHGVGGWLHKKVFEPLDRDYASWIAWGEGLGPEWHESVPYVGYAAGVIAGFIPWVAGTVGRVGVAVPAFLTPKTQEEHFLFVATADLGVVVSRTGKELKYGWWWLSQKLKKDPELASTIKNQGTKAATELVEQVERRAPETLRSVPAAGQGKAGEKTIEAGTQAAEVGVRASGGPVPQGTATVEKAGASLTKNLAKFPADISESAAAVRLAPSPGPGPAWYRSLARRGPYTVAEVIQDSGKIPATPGCYVFRSSDGTVLYVGMSGEGAATIRSRFAGAGYLRDPNTIPSGAHAGSLRILQHRAKVGDTKVTVEFYDGFFVDTGQATVAHPIGDPKGLEGSLIEELDPLFNTKKEGNRWLFDVSELD